jgi:hypothetical protein
MNNFPLARALARSRNSQDSGTQCRSALTLIAAQSVDECFPLLRAAACGISIDNIEDIEREPPCNDKRRSAAQHPASAAAAAAAAAAACYELPVTPAGAHNAHTILIT